MSKSELRTGKDRVLEELLPQKRRAKYKDRPTFIRIEQRL